MTTEEAKAKAFFEYTNRNWPEPKILWEALSDGAKVLWIERAAKQRSKT